MQTLKDICKIALRSAAIYLGVTTLVAVSVALASSLGDKYFSHSPTQDPIAWQFPVDLDEPTAMFSPSPFSSPAYLSPALTATPTPMQTRTPIQPTNTPTPTLSPFEEMLASYYLPSDAAKTYSAMDPSVKNDLMALNGIAKSIGRDIVPLQYSPGSIKGLHAYLQSIPADARPKALEWAMDMQNASAYLIAGSADQSLCDVALSWNLWAEKTGYDVMIYSNLMPGRPFPMSSFAETEEGIKDNLFTTEFNRTSPGDVYSACTMVEDRMAMLLGLETGEYLELRSKGNLTTQQILDFVSANGQFSNYSIDEVVSDIISKEKGKTTPVVIQYIAHSVYGSSKILYDNGEDRSKPTISEQFPTQLLDVLQGRKVVFLENICEAGVIDALRSRLETYN
ncbi:MAG: hypothetical protein HGA85_08870, partial [Nanoarchaeota archaeon]|nr:hypothetical protein [Nanoarchaeota archaeon]